MKAAALVAMVIQPVSFDARWTDGLLPRVSSRWAELGALLPILMTIGSSVVRPM